MAGSTQIPCSPRLGLCDQLPALGTEWQPRGWWIGCSSPHTVLILLLSPPILLVISFVKNNLLVP